MFLDKIKRIFRKNITPPIGAFACGLMVIFELINTIMIIVLLQQSGQGLADSNFLRIIINLMINAIFYLLVCNYFRKSYSNFYYAYYAMLLLTVSNYIIPLIFDFINIFTEGFAGNGSDGVLVFVGNLISSILGVLYFIFMILEAKNNKKIYLIILLILGGIIGFVAIYNLITGIYLEVIVLSEALNPINIVMSIIYILSIITIFLMSFLYSLYAFDLKRIRTRGY